MNLAGTFLLFVLMIVTFWLFGLIGIAILGIIMLLIYLNMPRIKTIPNEYFNESDGKHPQPCHAHGLPNCPFCYPKRKKTANAKKGGGRKP